MKKLLTLILILALQACGGLSLLDPATRSDSSSQVPQNDTPDPDNIPESPIYQDPTPLSPPDLCDGGVDYKNAPKDIFIVMPETVRVKGALTFHHVCLQSMLQPQDIVIYGFKKHQKVVLHNQMSIQSY
ncbi:MAG: hypothetical protein R3A45_07615 [Bdellovibrionota bacterium]